MASAHMHAYTVHTHCYTDKSNQISAAKTASTSVMNRWDSVLTSTIHDHISTSMPLECTLEGTRMNGADHREAQTEELQQMAQCILCLANGINHLLSSDF